MATISAAAPSIGNLLAQLISSGSSTPPAPAAASTGSASSSTATPSAGSGAAVFVTLSDQAKTAAAANIQSDQDAANRLQAYVDERRANNASTKTGAPVSLQSILETVAQSTDTPPADAQPTTGSRVEAIVAQIKSLAAANDPQPFQPFTPTKSLSNSVTVDGYTLTLHTNASTQYYGIELSGNGVQAYSKHFGPSAGGGGDTALPPGGGISIGIPNNNNEAIDAITVTRNIATASSASISSSSAGSISTSSVNAQSSSITFLVNYATGQISAEGSAASVSARSTSVGFPGSTLSTLA
jgi:hypothetical protein